MEKKKATPGPKPETVKIDGTWENAVKRAMSVPPKDAHKKKTPSEDGEKKSK